MTARTLVAVALLALTGAAACSDDPAGDLTVTVEASVPLGAAVLDLRGGRLDGVQPVSSGWAVLEALPSQDGQTAHRLLIVQEQPGILTVRLRVPSGDDRVPSATVLQASGADDRPLTSLGTVQVRVHR